MIAPSGCIFGFLGAALVLQGKIGSPTDGSSLQSAIVYKYQPREEKRHLEREDPTLSLLCLVLRFEVFENEES